MENERKPMSRRQLLKYTAQAGLGLVTVGALGVVSRSDWLGKLINPQQKSNRWTSFRLRDISRQTGVAVTHQKVVLDHKLDNIMPWMASVGAGVSAADYNNDGFIDVFVSSSGHKAACHLFRNNGDGTFTDVGAQAGVADLNREGGVMDAVWGDFDNDGWPDLYVVKWSARNRLFRNNRDGSFSDITES